MYTTVICYFNRFDLHIPKKAIAPCSSSGDCTDAVREWRLKTNFKHISDDDLKDELSEYGAWDEGELNNRENNEERILWIAAGNIIDNKED